jgi:hypothetical protein
MSRSYIHDVPQDIGVKPFNASPFFSDTLSTNRDCEAAIVSILAKAGGSLSVEGKFPAKAGFTSWVRCWNLIKLV